ncbi:MAG: endoribonuclease family protein 1 [Gammaproteobacteria bacterium]|jgi:reactive intermediate/imine deaminase|nr:endoribonuclease family protein 1 [Gammaproteobacteria bacterium]
MSARAIHTVRAPQPKGSYSQAIACGNLLFLSGQTPRDLDGTRLSHLPFEDQARKALENLKAVAEAGNSTLGNAVKVTVYLRDLANAAAFDAVYRDYISPPWPARTLVQSNFIDFEVEVDAILCHSPSNGR